MLAALLYGLYGVISKMVGIDFGVFFLGWSRGVIIGLVVLIIFFVRRHWIKLQTGDYKWFASMSTAGVISFLTIFVAFNYIPIGTALFVFFSSLIIASYVIGYWLFREQLTVSKLVLLGLSLAGLILLFYGRLDGDNWQFLALACISGISGAIWNVFSKKVSVVYPLSEIILIDAIMAIIICLPLSLVFREPVSFFNFFTELPTIGLFAFITIGANAMTFTGFKNLPAQIASIIMLLELVYGVIFGWLFFKEILSPLEMAGGILIILAVVLSSLIAKERVSI